MMINIMVSRNMTRMINKSSTKLKSQQNDEINSGREPIMKFNATRR